MRLAPESFTQQRRSRSRPSRAWKPGSPIPAEVGMRPMWSITTITGRRRINGSKSGKVRASTSSWICHPNSAMRRAISRTSSSSFLCPKMKLKRTPRKPAACISANASRVTSRSTSAMPRHFPSEASKASRVTEISVP